MGKSIINYLATKGVFDHIPDRTYLKLRYRATFHKRLDLKNPKSFNEKLNWLKLHDKNPRYIEMVDKYAAKNYVEKIIGEKYIIPTIGVWNRFDDINFDILPMKFVLKTTHDSGGVVIVKDKEKLNKNKVKQKLEKSLQHNFFKWSREWPYSQVKPRIIAEEFIEQSNGELINDYKIQCFNGQVDNIFVCVDRYSESGVKYHYFDCKFKYLPYCPYEGISQDNIDIKKPENFAEMIEISEKLSEGFPEIRVDLYNVDGKIYFGELTLYSMSGFDTTITEEADFLMGNALHIDMKNRIGVKKRK